MLLGTTAILQAETSECGLACLATVLNYFGHQTDLADLRRKWGGSERGMTLRSLITAAEMFNLDARPVKLDYTEVRELPRASILHWDGNHFVVFISYRLGYFNIVDPATGPKKIRTPEFKGSFTGIALELTPNSGFRVRRYKSPSIVPRLLAVVPGLYRSLGKLLALSLVLEIIALAFPIFTQVVVDEVVMTHDTGLMASVVCAVVALSVVQFGISLARGELSVRFKQASAQRLKVSVLRHLVELPLDWFSRRHVGDIVSRFSGITTIQNAFTTTSTQNILDGLMAVFTGGMVIAYGGWIGVIACLSVAVDVFLKLGLYARYRSITVSSAALDAQQQTHFLETVRNIASVKMTALASRRIRVWANKNVELSNVRSAQQRIEITAARVQELAAGIDRAIVLYLGGAAVLDGGMTVGALIAFLSYKDQTDRRISNLTTAMFSLRSLSVQSERLRDIVGTPEEASPRPQRASLPVANALSPHITATHLSKKYQTGSSWLFRDLSLRIETGSRVIIRGPSGCGKTTLLKVLIGLIEPTSGSLQTGPWVRTPQALHNYRSQFCGVLQDDSLFSGSLLENISCFDPKPEIDRVEECARAAMIFDDLTKMPMGLQTYVSAAASTLSGGQRQRILLARALYLDSPVIFLDEATSHLDASSEEVIMRHMLGTEKTVLFVSHRESLARHATMSLTFHGNRVVVSGSG
ncbi:peptidase domain-containing ABC transporter [Gluconacetobacter azotocaptans]|uniref:peptidase domain-containing ABC transporter n=1 Tax=Gluconacetobacter azotocaptans TaxID=142834 RepID=UPI001959EAA4|nr:peptidase domain-containing ABC transporter [Gluconacetobacter azotocaptans]MBM9400829.1 peptidase domain-containing ABC transporter [Gluconacetobacter azotocaptans]